MYQDVIADITKKMGHGMTVFFSRELDTEQDWNEVGIKDLGYDWVDTRHTSIICSTDWP